MKKVLVIGSGGAGKSTFARRLGRATGIEVIHLDAVYWGAGWAEPAKEEWRATVEELLKRDSWIMDGNYGGTLDLRLEACDAVVFLDLPRRVCLWRVLKRRALYRHSPRPDMAPGCPEKLDWKFLKFVWDYPRTRRPAVLEKLERRSRGKTVAVLRSQKEIENFLARQQAAHL